MFLTEGITCLNLSLSDPRTNAAKCKCSTGFVQTWRQKHGLRHPFQERPPDVTFIHSKLAMFEIVSCLMDRRTDGWIRQNLQRCKKFLITLSLFLKVLEMGTRFSEKTTLSVEDVSPSTAKPVLQLDGDQEYWRIYERLWCMYDHVIFFRKRDGAWMIEILFPKSSSTYHHLIKLLESSWSPPSWRTDNNVGGETSSPTKVNFFGVSQRKSSDQLSEGPMFDPRREWAVLFRLIELSVFTQCREKWNLVFTSVHRN